MMKILTKKQQVKLTDDLLNLFLVADDALQALATRQQEAFSVEELVKMQQHVIESVFDAAAILRGRFGILLIQSVADRKRELEEEKGWPLKRNI